MTVVENNVNTGNAATAADVADERPVVLKVDHVAKSFRLPTEQASGLKMAFLNWTKGIKGYTGAPRYQLRSASGRLLRHRRT